MTEDQSASIAPIPRRAIAYIIDAFIQTALAVVLIGVVVVAATVAGPQGMIGTLVIGGIIAALVLLAWLMIYTLMQAGNGSIGMRAQGLRLATATGGARLGFGRALLRNVVFWAACAIVVGYFTPLFDGSGRFQGWHDKAAGALMLSARATASAPVTEKTDAAAAVPAAPGVPVPSGVPAAPAPAAPASEAPRSAPAPSTARPAASTDQDPLIAFVPGVSRSAALREDVSAPQTGADELDATVQAPSAAAQAAPPAPSRPAAAPPQVPVATEPDDVEDTRISIPGHRLVFTWDDGTRTAVSRRTIFGRNPTPEDGALVVSVRDETLSLSKTHFEAAAEPSGGWVRDRHSTNGMTLVRDGQRIACPAGQRVTVRLGDAIEIGDRIVTIGGYA